MAAPGRPTPTGRSAEARGRRRGARAAALLAAGAAGGALAVWTLRPAPPVPAPPPPAAEASARAGPAPEAAPPPPPAPAADAPAPAPPEAGTAEPLVGAEGAPTRALVRDALASAIARHDPGLKLSSDELDAAADALWRLRTARLELARLGDDPAHAARRAALVEAIGEATADFTYYVEMSPAAFTALDRAEGDLSAPPPEAAPRPEVTR